MDKLEKFLTPEEEKKKAKEWRESARHNEKAGHYDYIGRRVEGLNVQGGDIASLHRISFIGEIIPKLLTQKKPGEKVKVLDVGGGAGLYAEQIRKAFPNLVKVFTTGLSKKTAKQQNPEQHPDNLRWRSIRQLSRFDEFDLIIDTYGEAAYGTLSSRSWHPGGDYEAPEMEKYLEAVIEKLKPGGIASLKTTMNWYPDEIKSRLEKRYPDISIKTRNHGNHIYITKALPSQSHRGN